METVTGKILGSGIVKRFQSPKEISTGGDFVGHLLKKPPGWFQSPKEISTGGDYLKEDLFLDLYI